jgi:hypothetical protein
MAAQGGDELRRRAEGEARAETEIEGSIASRRCWVVGEMGGDAVLIPHERCTKAAVGPCAHLA